MNIRGFEIRQVKNRTLRASLVVNTLHWNNYYNYDSIQISQNFLPLFLFFKKVISYKS